jgi:hypothetical protein
MSTIAAPRSNTRPVLSLDGTWHFSFTGAAARLDGERQIKVPGVWQAQFAELRNSTGTGTYRRTVEVSAEWSGKRAVLVFEGVFHETTIRINGEPVARHDNAWTPIELDVTRCPRFELEVTARVPDERNYAERGLGVMLHGKQDWYGLQGGIWKSVRLEARDPLHIANLAVATETDLATHAVTVRGHLEGGSRGSVALSLARDGRIAAEQRFDVGAEFSLRLPVPAVDLWSPDAPNLYELTVTAGADAQTRTVGFRRFESRDGRLWLNGEPFYMFGALDQDWYPEEESRHPDAAFLEQRFRNARAIGLNTLRCHVKIPDPLYLELADRLGLVVWLDMPYMEFLAPETREQLTETFGSAVDNHGHHPSICIWTIINEGWGIDLDDNPDDRRWLRQSFDALKRRVPQSLVVDNSPCFPRNYHVKTDIEDFHWYNSWPSQNAWFARTTGEFAAHPAWTFTPHGDGERSGAEPLVCSEFGVWGLPHLGDIMEQDGSEPWWFESGHDWNNGAGYPHGIETRFRDAQLGPVFGDLDGFVAAAQDTQYRALKYQIETLRYAEPISGYIITELNDTQWEANGLMDARNNLRAFGNNLHALQQPWLLVARPERTALSAGETVAVPVRLAGAARLSGDAVLAWRFGDASGTATLPAGPTGSTEISLSLTAPAASAIAIETLELEARDTSGALLGRGTHEFCIVPSVGDAPALEPADEGAKTLLAALGYPSAPGGTLLATQLTTPLREQLIAGRKVLLVANAIGALSDPERNVPAGDSANFPKMQLREREGTPWDGRWMGAFSWRRTDGPWAELPNGPMLDEHWGGLIPKYVLTGFRSTAFGGLVDAGIAVAWLHKAAALTKRTFLGRGWMTVSTFDFTSDEARQNPLAPHLLKALAQS